MTANKPIELAVNAEQAGRRIDRVVAQTTGLSRNFVQQLIAANHILLNGKKPAKSALLEQGDVLSVTVPLPEDERPQKQNIHVDVVHEDASLFIVNKPKGMVVHPDSNHTDGTLVNALLYRYGEALSSAGPAYRPGIVHRLDKDTSGLLVIAKDNETHRQLERQFADQSVKRVYDAVVYGALPQQDGTVEAPISRSLRNRTRMTASRLDGRAAKTSYHVVQNFAEYSHIEVQLFTGRTHQIRVHMASIGHPLAGDTVYGPQNALKFLNGQCLNATTLGFVHPGTRRYVEFSSGLPTYFTNFLQWIKKHDDNA